MAPSNDTGEHATPLPKSELEVDSSSHMHELHFPPAGKACASDSASRSPSTLVGQENARLTSMPPLVVPVRSSSLVRSSPSKKNRRSLRKAAHVRDKLSIDSTSGGDNTIVLRIIDLNVVAASALPKDVDVTKRPPNDRQESAHEYGGLGQGPETSPKTSPRAAKRKSSKTANGMKQAVNRNPSKEDIKEEPKEEDASPSQPISYADVVKESPAKSEMKSDAGLAEEETSQDQEPEDSQTKPEFHPGDDENSPVRTNGFGKVKPAAATTGKSAGKDSHEYIPDSATTYAQVVKEKAAGAVQNNGHTQESANKTEAEDGATSPGSTAVEFPDIPYDDAEERERQREREKAAEVAGVRWAPMQVPVKRRLQTAAVLFHSLCMGTTLSIFFFLCAVPFIWPIIIIYLVSILFATDATDGKLKKRKEWFRRLPIWRFFADYFPAKLHKTHDLVPTRKYIFGYHPHGIISHGAWVAFASDALGFAEKFPGITNSLLTLDSNFRLPLYREYVFSMGVLSVSKESITNILTRGGRNNEGMGRAVTIVVGGARESLEARPNTMRLIINERKGFIKLALRTGADLVPVLAFGENDLYDQLDPHSHPWLHGLQRHILKVWKFTLPLLHGRGIFNYDAGMMPYRRPLNIVVGKPIKVVQEENPDNKEVDRLHTLYVEELQAIWERYKDEFATHRKEEMQFLS